MPAFLIPVLRNWKLIGLGLLVLALVVQTLRLDSAKSKLKAERAEHAALIDRMKAEAQRQKKTTSGNITKAREGMKQVEPIARKIETAPLYPREQCKTPDSVLSADL